MNARRQRLKRVRKLIFWASVVTLSSLSGGLWFAYSYLTNSETVAQMVRAESPRFLKDGWVDLGHARLRLGGIALTQVRVLQKVDGSTFLAARVPWLQVRQDPWALLEGRFEPKEITAAQPSLRLVRRKDGSWNLPGFFIGKPMSTPPPVLIQNGTVELVTGPEPGARASAILRDVSLKILPAGKGKLTFEGDAKGDLLEKVAIGGSIDVATGRVELRGDLDRLTIGEPLRKRMPPEFRDAFDKLGLTGGEVDVQATRVAYDPHATPPLRYDIAGRLRAGTWNCPKLPFPLSLVQTRFAARDGVVAFDQFDGVYGTTVVRVERASVDANDPVRAPFDLKMHVVDVELDEKLKARTPAPLLPLWRQYRPSGRVNVAVEASRETRDGPVKNRVTVDCLDVAIVYEHFKYPLDHIHGRFVWEKGPGKDRVDILGVETLVGGKPLTAKGEVLSPGPKAEVRLSFRGEAMPVDKTLLDAMPPDVLKVVRAFNPTGSVSATAELRRSPPDRENPDPRGKVRIDAVLDLNEGCGIRWKGLPYPVNNLTGRLEIHPDLWTFSDMHGTNGQAELTGSGRVSKAPGKEVKLTLDLDLRAKKLPFDRQLFDALQPAWQKSWKVLDPTGSSDVDAHIKLRPGVPDDYTLTITPRPATAVNLRYTREAGPGDPGGTFLIRMEDVNGRFVFKNGPVDMGKVKFRFHGAPVEFDTGRVVVDNDGRFAIGVRDLWVKDIRLDPRLQSIMPPVMAQFARRFDDGRALTLKGNLGLKGSGTAGSAVLCTWDGVRVVFVDNSVRSASGMTLEHVQGQLVNVHGRADGTSLEVHGALDLESVSTFGQQVTRLESPIDVDHGVLRLDDLKGTLLGGALAGKLSVSLEDTPRYATTLSVNGADLQQYAKNLAGHQTFRGKVNAKIDLSGVGGDPRTLKGSGDGQLIDGDLGQLPAYLQVFKLLTLAPATKTAFDSAEVAFTVRNGKTFFEPIRFTGDAFSLHGRGTMDVRGNLDLAMRVLYGRDRVKIWFLNDALREASGQIVVIRVQGSPSNPTTRLDALPEVGDAFKSAIGQRRERRAERLDQQ